MIISVRKLFLINVVLLALFAFPIFAAQFQDDNAAEQFCNSVLRVDVVKQYKQMYELYEEKPCCTNLMAYRRWSTAMKGIAGICTAGVATLSAAAIGSSTEFNVPILVLSLVAATSTALDHVWFQESESYYQQRYNKLGDFIDTTIKKIIEQNNIADQNDLVKIRRAIPIVLEQKRVDV